MWKKVFFICYNIVNDSMECTKAKEPELTLWSILLLKFPFSHEECESDRRANENSLNKLKKLKYVKFHLKLSLRVKLRFSDNFIDAN